MPRYSLIVARRFNAVVKIVTTQTDQNTLACVVGATLHVWTSFATLWAFSQNRRLTLLAHDAAFYFHCWFCRTEYPSVGPIDFVEDDRLLQEMRTTEIDEFAGNDESQVVRPDVRRCRAQRWMP